MISERTGPLRAPTVCLHGEIWTGLLTRKSEKLDPRHRSSGELYLVSYDSDQSLMLEASLSAGFCGPKARPKTFAERCLELCPCHSLMLEHQHRLTQDSRPLLRSIVAEARTLASCRTICHVRHRTLYRPGDDADRANGRE